MDIYDFLSTHNIAYERFDHEAVYTCEQADALPPMPGAQTKNLFVRDRKGVRHFLVTIGYEKSVDLKALAAALDVSKLSFGSDERLINHLGVEPGSVTLLGLINDPDHKVEVVIDQSIWDAESALCHPLVNTTTLSISHTGLEAFLQATGHDVRVMDVPNRQ